MRNTYWINKRQNIGAVVTGWHSELEQAIKNCPITITDAFESVTPMTYDDWVLDLRYEDGEWQQ
jgi:hypothetical protein